MFSRYTFGVFHGHRAVTSRARVLPQRATFTTTPQCMSTLPENEYKASKSRMKQHVEASFRLDVGRFERGLKGQHGDDWKSKLTAREKKTVKRIERRRAQWQTHLREGTPWPPPPKPPPEPYVSSLGDDGWSRKRLRWLYRRVLKSPGGPKSLSSIVAWAKRVADPNFKDKQETTRFVRNTVTWLLRLEEQEGPNFEALVMEKLSTAAPELTPQGAVAQAADTAATTAARAGRTERHSDKNVAGSATRGLKVGKKVPSIVTDVGEKLEEMDK